MNIYHVWYAADGYHRHLKIADISAQDAAYEFHRVIGKRDVVKVLDHGNPIAEPQIFTTQELETK